MKRVGELSRAKWRICSEGLRMETGRLEKKERRKELMGGEDGEGREVVVED